MRKLICAACAAASIAGSAQAATVEFSYANTFDTRVENVTSTALALRGAYQDPDAARGLYNGSSSILITGRYDDADIVRTGSDQYVTVQVNSIVFDSLQVVFTDLNLFTGVNPATLSLTSAGGLAIFFDAPDVGRTDVYGTTSITSQLNRRDSSVPAFSLGRSGEYGTDNSRLVDLYGRNNARYDPSPIADDPYYFNRYGALVANSFSTGGNRPVLEGGVFTLTATVPEPATWAMMIAGFGVVGGGLRLRRRGGSVAQV